MSTMIVRLVITLIATFFASAIVAGLLAAWDVGGKQQQLETTAGVLALGGVLTFLVATIVSDELR